MATERLLLLLRWPPSSPAVRAQRRPQPSSTARQRRNHDGERGRVWRGDGVQEKSPVLNRNPIKSRSLGAAATACDSPRSCSHAHCEVLVLVLVQGLRCGHMTAPADPTAAANPACPLRLLLLWGGEHKALLPEGPKGSQP